MKKGETIYITNGDRKRFVGKVKSVKGNEVSIILHHNDEELKTSIDNVKPYTWGGATAEEKGAAKDENNSNN